VDGNVDAVTLGPWTNPLAGDGQPDFWIGGSPDPGDGATKNERLDRRGMPVHRALSQAEVQSL